MTTIHAGNTLIVNGVTFQYFVGTPFEGSDLDAERERPNTGDPLSSCPYKPGTDEWKQWQHDYLAINPSTRTSAPDEFDRAENERELGRIMAASRLPVERVAYLNQMMREAREAIDECGPDRRKLSPFTINVSGITAGFLALSAAMGNLAPHIVHFYNNEPWNGQPVGPTGTSRAERRTAPPGTVHVGSKRRRRPTAPAARDCRHGNPSNHCRDCSMGRR